MRILIVLILLCSCSPRSVPKRTLTPQSYPEQKTKNVDEKSKKTVLIYFMLGFALAIHFLDEEDKK